MNVGILSMQRIKNYGSFLQAYSLKRNVENLGHNVQFVDYVVGKPISIDKGNNLSDKKENYNFVRIFSALRRKLGIRTRQESLAYERMKFKKRYDNEFFEILGLTKEKNFTPKVDTLLIGSDEVFNCLQKNPDVGYSKQLFGAENNANRLITYAASFGNTTLDGLGKYNIKEEISQMLSKFDAISVRDNNTKNIIEQLTTKQCITHLDPVFIYDYPEIDDFKVKIKDYIVVYAYTNRIKKDEAIEIKKFAKKHNKIIVCIGEYQSFCDKYISANPFELLAYIKNADYIVTDTFHGTVFSIKFNKHFATIVRPSNGGKYGNQEKIGSLLAKFNLKDRELDNISELEQKLLQNVGFETVNEIIALEKKRSLQYLEENIF